MRILGLDYGDSRIGVAMSDPFGWTASGIGFIDARKGEEKVIGEIRKILEEYKAEKIVIGYPLNMNGTAGPRAMITDSFISVIHNSFPEIEIDKWDERLTSVAANRIMREMGISQRKKGTNDRIAAVLILQSYLDCKTKKEEK